MLGSPIKSYSVNFCGGNTSSSESSEEDMKMGCSVTNKIDCMYQCEMTSIPSEKPGRDNNQRLATEEFHPEMKDLLTREKPNIFGKIDGTCTYVHTIEGVPTLCFRRDLRIGTKGKVAGKYVSKKGRVSKPQIPDGWVTFHEKPDHKIAKGKWAHHIGFIPLAEDTPKHFKEVFDEEMGCLKILSSFEEGKYAFQWIPIAMCVGMSFELVGPKIQSDPHKIGFHCLVSHTSIQVHPRSILLEDVKAFLTEHSRLEGIVLHFPQADKCFKVHRGHLGMKWVH